MKWHNGPNGPGRCRAKQGNCPFGGEDSHFNSLQEAEQAYKSVNEQEFGILPEIKKADNRETKVQAYNSHGISLASSSFVKMSGRGFKHDGEYIENILKQANMDSQKMVQLLNKDDNIYGAWKVKEEVDDKITLETKDSFGNVQFIDIKKIEPKKRTTKPGQIKSYNKHGINTSLSNYVATASGGYEESRKYFNNLIQNANLNSDKMIKALNKDKRVFGIWSLESENENEIKLEQEDPFGNINYIVVYKK